MIDNPCSRNSDNSNYLVFTQTEFQIWTQSLESVGPIATKSLWGRHWAWTVPWETKAQGPCCGHSSAKPSQSPVIVPSIPSRHLVRLQVSSNTAVPSDAGCRCWFYLSEAPSGFLLLYASFRRSVPPTWLLCFYKETDTEFLILLQKSGSQS